MVGVGVVVVMVVVQSRKEEKMTHGRRGGAAGGGCCGLGEASAREVGAKGVAEGATAQSEGRGNSKSRREGREQPSEAAM